MILTAIGKDATGIRFGSSESSATVLVEDHGG
jgi:hypothetical protein